MEPFLRVAPVPGTQAMSTESSQLLVPSTTATWPKGESEAVGEVLPNVMIGLTATPHAKTPEDQIIFPLPARSEHRSAGSSSTSQLVNPAPPSRTGPARRRSHSHAPDPQRSSSRRNASEPRASPHRRNPYAEPKAAQQGTKRQKRPVDRLWWGEERRSGRCSRRASLCGQREDGASLTGVFCRSGSGKGRGATEGANQRGDCGARGSPCPSPARPVGSAARQDDREGRYRRFSVEPSLW